MAKPFAGKEFRKATYTIGQWTWGLPQTILGAAMFLAHKGDAHFDYNGAKVTIWDRRDGVSLGKFVFIPKVSAHGRIRSVYQDPASDIKVDSFLLNHEYGHTIQSLILGPLYLLLIGMPSFLWNRLPYFNRKREKTGRSYYTAVFESTANQLGEKASHRRRKQ